MVKNDYGQNLTYQCDSCSRRHPKWQGKCDGCNEWNKIVILGRTHGQPAVPTTMGKEFKVFSYRLEKQIYKFSQIKLRFKAN